MRGFKICLLFFANVALFQLLEAKEVYLEAEGVIAPVFTAFSDKDKVDVDIVPQYAQYLCDNDVDGVLVVGVAGEGPDLSVKEKKKLIDAWVKAAKPLNLFVIVQVGGVPLPDSIELAKYSENAGVDGILCLPELYYKPKTPKQLVYNVKFVADAAPNTPFLYDDLPDTSDVNIVDFFLLATEKISNFKGINTYNFATALKLQDQLIDDQRIFIEDSVYVGPAALTGFKNYILYDVNLFPGLVNAIVKNGNNGYQKTTRSQYRRLRDLFDAIVDNYDGNELAPLKAAMPFVTGLDLGDVRAPLMRLSDEQKTRIRENLRREDVDIVDDTT